MNQNQKKRSVEDFLKPDPDEERNRNNWTDEDLLAMAKRIMKRLGITETLYKPGEEE